MTRVALATMTALMLASSTSHAQTPPTPAAPADNVSFTGRPGAGVTVALREPSLSLTLSGRVDVRATLTVPPTGDAQTEVSIRTVRLVLSGHAFSPDVRFYTQLALAPADFEAGSSSPLYDAWVSWTRLRDAQLRVGQFFVPFDRARTVRESSLQFVDRQAVVGELNLDRDAGIELSSRDLFGWGGRLQYALGVFSGEGRNRAGAVAGFLYVARLQVNPFGAFDDNIEGDLERRHAPRLAVGVAGAYNQRSTRARSTLGATLTHGDFDFFHAAADLHLKWYGISLLAEALWRHADAPYHAYTASMQAQREWSRSAWGAFAQLGVVFVPRLEAVVRYGYTDSIGDTDPELQRQVATQGNELAAGLNWYIDGHAYKVQADWQATFGERFSDARHLARVQVQLTL